MSQARNTIIFGGLRLLKVLLKWSLVVLDSALHIYPEEISRQALKYLMTSSMIPLNLQEALSEQLGENWGFPQDTQSCLYLFFHSCPDPCAWRQQYPWVGAHEAPTGSVTTPLLHGWGLNIHPLVPICLTSPVWREGDSPSASLHSPRTARVPPTPLSTAGLWKGAEGKSWCPSAW